MTEERLAALWRRYQETHDPHLARQIAVWEAIYGEQEARDDRHDEKR